MSRDSLEVSAHPVPDHRAAADMCPVPDARTGSDRCTLVDDRGFMNILVGEGVVGDEGQVVGQQLLAGADVHLGQT